MVVYWTSVPKVLGSRPTRSVQSVRNIRFTQWFRAHMKL